VAKMTDSERRALESEGRELRVVGSAAKPDATRSEIRYVYYLLYANNYEMPSKVTIDLEQPHLGRIRADSVAPPHSPTSIKRCISRVERNPALALPEHADLFADTSCDAPLEEGHISILRNDGPGLSPNEPMAIVQVKNPSIPDGKYLIKNRAADIYWGADDNPINTIYFHCTTKEEDAKKYDYYHWNITQDANGNISMRSVIAPSSWVGADMTGSTVPVPWQLIPADGKSYYLTTDMNDFSQNPRVAAVQDGKFECGPYGDPGTKASLKEGDQWQMWEFIRI